MKKTKKILLIVISVLLLTTGCAKNLTDNNKAVVVDKNTGQSLTKNILCRPTDPKVIELYNQNKSKVDISELPECSDFGITKVKYESIWDTIFVRPIAWVMLKIGGLFNNYSIGIIVLTIILNIITIPFTQKMIRQSKDMQKAQKEMEAIQKKYMNSTSKDDYIKQSAEMSMVYKKYDINPFTSFASSILQLVIFIAYLEAIRKIPVIFEAELFGLKMGISPFVALQQGNIIYLLIAIINVLLTYYSLTKNQEDRKEVKIMSIVMSLIILFAVLFNSTAINVYFLVNNAFRLILQSLSQRKREVKK